MRKARGLLGIIVGLTLLLQAGGAVAYADDRGNNGTVKIHEGSTEAEPIRRNEPHVCTFHVHGFNFDASSSGTWRIDRHAPTGEGQAAADTWSADASGEWRTQVMTLPEGHYKLYAKQTTPETAGDEKQKVFWVECGEESTTTGGQGNVTGVDTTTTGGGTAGSGAQGYVNVPTGGDATAGVSPTVSNLPATSTVGANAGLAGLGALLTLVGAFLLRRPGRQTR